MKQQISFLLVLMAFSLEMNAQTKPIKKLYAYSQEILPGKKSNHPVTPKLSYRLFVTVNPKQKIMVTGIWLNNNYYNLTTKNIPAKQVLNENSNFEKTILVAKTTNNVFELVLTRQIDPAPRPNSKLGSLLKSNEVVVAYLWKGKEYFSALKKITVLETFAAM